MITQLQKDLETTGAPCDVQRVFAMWDRDTGDGNPRGTINPFYTALPLAQAVKNPPSDPNLPICPPPRTTPPLTGYTPEMCFEDAGYPTTGKKYYLCEYPVDNVGPLKDPDNNCEKNAGIKQDGTSSHRNALFTYPDQADPRVHSYLLNYFQANPSSSVAIFYTSQGMPGVSMTLGANPQIADCAGTSPCKQIFPPDPPTPEQTLPPSKFSSRSRLRVLYEAF
jgi:hypothetical protein